MTEFRPQAPSAETVFYRTYSRRKEDGTRENFKEAMTRTIDDIARIGKLSPEEHALIMEQAIAQKKTVASSNLSILSYCSLKLLKDALVS